MLTIKNITCSAKIKHAIYTRLMNKKLITSKFRTPDPWLKINILQKFHSKINLRIFV